MKTVANIIVYIGFLLAVAILFIADGICYPYMTYKQYHENKRSRRRTP